MKKLIFLLLLLLIAIPCFAQQQEARMSLGVVGGSVPVAPPANNVAIVSGHITGEVGNASTEIDANFGGANVTSGNTVLCGVAGYSLGSIMTSAMLTQTLGTATVGTIVLDQTYFDGDGISVGIYRVPITGTGTITLTFTPGGNKYILFGCAEFSGVDNTTVSTKNNVTGTGTAHSTGSIITTNLGVMMYVASEIASTTFVRTYSDTLIYNSDTGESAFTGIVQYKIINSSPNTLTDTTGEDSSAWSVSYALYKTN